MRTWIQSSQSSRVGLEKSKRKLVKSKIRLWSLWKSSLRLTGLPWSTQGTEENGASVLRPSVSPCQLALTSSPVKVQSDLCSPPAENLAQGRGNPQSQGREALRKSLAFGPNSLEQNSFRLEDILIHCNAMPCHQWHLYWTVVAMERPRQT